jgi:hypothetical protein
MRRGEKDAQMHELRDMVAMLVDSRDAERQRADQRADAVQNSQSFGDVCGGPPC